MSKNEVLAYVELFGSAPGCEEDVSRIDPKELFYRYNERTTFPALVAKFHEKYGD